MNDSWKTEQEKVVVMDIQPDIKNIKSIVTNN